jgi:hypothetical protein
MGPLPDTYKRFFAASRQFLRQHWQKALRVREKLSLSVHVYQFSLFKLSCFLLAPSRRETSSGVNPSIPPSKGPGGKAAVIVDNTSGEIKGIVGLGFGCFRGTFSLPLPPARPVIEDVKSPVENTCLAGRLALDCQHDYGR